MGQVVELTIKKLAVAKGTVVPQSEASARLGIPPASKLTAGGWLTGPVLQSVRYNSGDHLPRKTKVKGIGKDCRNRSFFRCICCQVSLHPECFYSFHTPEHL